MKLITLSTFITQMKCLLVRVTAKLLTQTKDFESNARGLLLSALISTVRRIVPEEEYVTRVEMEGTPVSATIHLMTHPGAGRCRCRQFL